MKPTDQHLIEPFSFEYRIRKYTENGMIIKMYKCAHHNSRAACRTEGVSLFQNLDEYIKENSGQFSDLVLNNFWSIFFSYFVACFIAFSAFCVHNLVKFVKNVIEIVKSRRNRTEKKN